MLTKVRSAGIALLTTVFAVTAKASSITVNGNCEVGTCSAGDVLSLGQSQTTPFDFTYTFANSDQYRLAGSVSASFLTTGFLIQVQNLVATYEGNQIGSASASDVLQADFTQRIANPQTALGNAFETIGGVFGPDLGDASSAMGQFLIAGAGLPLLGPYFSTSSSSFSGSADGELTLPAGTPLLDYRYTTSFGDGSEVGSSISINPAPPSQTPEPGSLLLFGTGATAFLSLSRRRQARSTADSEPVP